MIASQFNLDHRLAELRQAGAEIRREQAARAAAGPAQNHSAMIRSSVDRVPARRPAGLAAR